MDYTKAHRLKENLKLSFQGCELAGKGFVISASTAKSWIKEDSKNQDVLKVMIDGKTLVTPYMQKDWVIDFNDMSLEEYENLKYLLGEEYDDKSEDTESEIYMDDETIEEYATKELLAFGMEKWSKYEDNKYVWPNRYNKLEDTIKMVASIDESTLDTADDIFNVRAAKRLVAFKDAYLPNDDWPLVADYVDTVYD